MGLTMTGERQIAGKLSDIKPNHVQRYKFAIDQLRKRFGYKTITVLDSACGNGYGSHMMSLENFKVLGIDTSEDAIAMAEQVYSTDFTTFDVVSLSDENAWPFKDSRFDAIVSIETIEHVEDDLGLVKRYAQSTDVLIATVPNQDVVPFDAKEHPFHCRHYTKDEFEKLLNDAGFVVQSWWTQYGKWYPEATVVEGYDGMGLMVMAVNTYRGTAEERGGNL